MIVGGIEEVRIDEPANEVYVADNYLGGRVMVFALDTFAFKRGWGARGTPLNQISVDDKDRDYTPGGPMPKNFAGHLTLNFSNDGLVYAADRNANRIDVTDKQGKYIKEFTIAEMTGNGGSTGGVAFSPDKEQKQLVDFRPHQQHHLVPQPRGRENSRPHGQYGGERRAVLRPAHDRHRFQRLYLHR